MTFNRSTGARQVRMSARPSRAISACHVLADLRVDPGEVNAATFDSFLWLA
jgi:hypothetical protein